MWTKKLTNKLLIFEVLQVYEIPFLGIFFQKTTLKSIHMTQEERVLVDGEI